jgi:hypothetical protein
MSSTERRMEIRFSSVITTAAIVGHDGFGLTFGQGVKRGRGEHRSMDLGKNCVNIINRYLRDAPRTRIQAALRPSPTLLRARSVPRLHHESGARRLERHTALWGASTCTSTRGMPWAPRSTRHSEQMRFFRSIHDGSSGSAARRVTPRTPCNSSLVWQLSDRYCDGLTRHRPEWFKASRGRARERVQEDALRVRGAPRLERCLLPTNA